MLPKVFYLDALEASKPLSVTIDNPRYEKSYIAIIYDKGSLLIRMMESFLTPSTFRTGLADYFSQFAYSNAVQDDLWDVLGEAGHRTGTLSPEVSLATVMDTWTLQKGYPVVTVSFMDLCGGSVMQLKQEKFWLAGASSAEDEFTWWIPITYLLVESQETGFYWLNETFGSIPLLDRPVEEPYVLNLNQEGYYRVNYPEKNWNALTSMLLANTTSLSPQTRAQLLDDSLNLARAGFLPYSVALNMTRYLAKELDLVPWNSVLNYGLSYLDVRFHSSENDYTLLQNYLRYLLELVYGTAESEDLVGEKLRYLVMTWSCYLESSTCLDMAKDLWGSWKLSSHWESEVAPEDKGWAYCNGIRQVDPHEIYSTKLFAFRVGQMTGN